MHLPTMIGAVPVVWRLSELADLARVFHVWASTDQYTIHFNWIFQLENSLWMFQVENHRTSQRVSSPHWITRGTNFVGDTLCLVDVSSTKNASIGRLCISAAAAGRRIRKAGRTSGVSNQDISHGFGKTSWWFQIRGM